MGLIMIAFDKKSQVHVRTQHGSCDPSHFGLACDNYRTALFTAPNSQPWCLMRRSFIDCKLKTNRVNGGRNQQMIDKTTNIQ